MATEEPSSGAVLSTGLSRGMPGWADCPRPPEPPIAAQDSAAATSVGGVAADSWPGWARRQLAAAVELSELGGTDSGLAGYLYRNWFHPVVGDCGTLPAGPLAGVYRAAHAGSARPTRVGGLSVLQRYDAIRPGGWWRTWGEHWVPRTSRRSVRLLFTPRVDRLGEFVATMTDRLLAEPAAWSLACALDTRRLARSGCAVLDLQALPELDAVPAGLLSGLEPLLRPVTPPLCLPIAPGVGAAEYPDNGMTFGEHRCHLLAVALRHPSSARDPLRAIAAVFRAHGLDPAQPYRNA